jgi:hypothetical protein
MNSMFIEFSGGQISRTDYFQSRDCEEGRAWMEQREGSWHVLIPPRFSCRPTVALARPVVDHSELDGWRWRLEFAGHRLQLPRRQIHSYRPALPEPFTRSRRTLHLYASETPRHGGQSFFGSVEPGVQLHATCPLLLVREVEAALKQRLYLG